MPASITIGPYRYAAGCHGGMPPSKPSKPDKIFFSGGFDPPSVRIYELLKTLRASTIDGITLLAPNEASLRLNGKPYRLSTRTEPMETENQWHPMQNTYWTLATEETVTCIRRYQEEVIDGVGKPHLWGLIPGLIKSHMEDRQEEVARPRIEVIYSSTLPGPEEKYLGLIHRVTYVIRSEGGSAEGTRIQVNDLDDHRTTYGVEQWFRNLLERRVFTYTNRMEYESRQTLPLPPIEL